VIIYSMLDRKLKEFGALVCANNDEAVKRALRDAVKQGPSLMSEHPDDFDLVRVGEFDVETGVIRVTDVPTLVDSVSTIIGKPIPYELTELGKSIPRG